MSHINTISEFLLQAGTDYRVFDMGRGYHSISSQTFLDIENALIPAPYPRQQHAWFGLIFFNKHLNNEHYIWFVKLPLDERGLLISAGRNHFLQIIIDALGLQLENTTETKGQLPENPYSFVPNQQQLADFNSISRQELKLGNSTQYPIAVNYFQQPEQTDWREVPLQGITDIAARAKQKDTINLLIKNFTKLAPEVQKAFCASLEHQELGNVLSKHLNTWLLQDFSDQNRLHSCLRALSQSSAKSLVKKTLLKTLNSEHANDENVFILIAARHWQHLTDEKLLKLFVNKLTELNSEVFTSLFADLVQIPMLRTHMLNVLRWPEKSSTLTAVIGQLFSGQSNEPI
jgi:hypothetical protein